MWEIVSKFVAFLENLNFQKIHFLSSSIALLDVDASLPKRIYNPITVIFTFQLDNTKR